MTRRDTVVNIDPEYLEIGPAGDGSTMELPSQNSAFRGTTRDETQPLLAASSGSENPLLTYLIKPLTFCYILFPKLIIEAAVNVFVARKAFEVSIAIASYYMHQDAYQNYKRDDVQNAIMVCQALYSFFDIGCVFLRRSHHTVEFVDFKNMVEDKKRKIKHFQRLGQQHPDLLDNFSRHNSKDICFQAIMNHTKIPLNELKSGAKTYQGRGVEELIGTQGYLNAVKEESKDFLRNYTSIADLIKDLEKFKDTKLLDKESRHKKMIFWLVAALCFVYYACTAVYGFQSLVELEKTYPHFTPEKGWKLDLFASAFTLSFVMASFICNVPSVINNAVAVFTKPSMLKKPKLFWPIVNALGQAFTTRMFIERFAYDRDMPEAASGLMQAFFIIGMMGFSFFTAGVRFISPFEKKSKAPKPGDVRKGKKFSEYRPLVKGLVAGNFIMGTTLFAWVGIFSGIVVMKNGIRSAEEAKSSDVPYLIQALSGEMDVWIPCAVVAFFCGLVGTTMFLNFLAPDIDYGWGLGKRLIDKGINKLGLNCSLFAEDNANTTRGSQNSLRQDIDAVRLSGNSYGAFDNGVSSNPQLPRSASVAGLTLDMK